ncbi:type III secretion system stator protein SctL [Pseudomonas asuensis]|uniref:Type III secretion protein n=1 Tax=Pseudomonas asuensis TaxID=1825787 RepID=A0ABQ2H4P6_9PSED|nr:type III secretion system stator protein SctL [Pseudomonas asuensis]GGM31244.1 type III secretion protein [Pseudomonas asuensis]
MLVKRTLSLGSPVINEPILRREAIADAWRAQEVLDQALQQADLIRAKAVEEGQQQVDQTIGEFWNIANAFLQTLEAEREAFRRDILISVEELLNLSLSRLLDDTDLPERIRALLRDLAQSQSVDMVATLNCHPDLAESVSQWLSHSRFAALWRIESDASMPLAALRLSHATGAFEVDWDSLRNGLMIMSS